MVCSRHLGGRQTAVCSLLSWAAASCTDFGQVQRQFCFFLLACAWPAVTVSQKSEPFLKRAWAACKTETAPQAHVISSKEPSSLFLDQEFILQTPPEDGGCRKCCFGGAPCRNQPAGCSQCSGSPWDGHLWGWSISRRAGGGMQRITSCRLGPIHAWPSLEQEAACPGAASQSHAPAEAEGYLSTAETSPCGS